MGMYEGAQENIEEVCLEGEKDANESGKSQVKTIIAEKTNERNGAVWWSFTAQHMTSYGVYTENLGVIKWL